MMTSLIRIGFWLLTLPLLLLATACGGSTSPVTPTPQEPIQPGVEGPDFTLPASDGTLVSLADYRGQPVLLYFHMAMG